MFVEACLGRLALVGHAACLRCPPPPDDWTTDTGNVCRLSLRPFPVTLIDSVSNMTCLGLGTSNFAEMQPLGPLPIHGVV